MLKINDIRKHYKYFTVLQISFKSVFNSGPQEKRTLIPLLVQSEGITVDIIKEYCR